MTSHTPILIAIAAMSENRVIGRGNRIPWHLPEDLKWFRRLTTGHTIVMGRKTFESIGRALPGRKTVVLSRSGYRHPDVETVADFRLIPPSPAPDGRVFICGGAEIYRETLPSCAGLFLTHVKRPAEGDTFFPPFEHLFTPAQVISENADFKVVEYRRGETR